MRGSTNSWLLLILLLLSPAASFSQSKSQLEERKKKLQQEINETNNQLRETSKNKNLTAAQVDALKKKIRLRQQMINTITAELNNLNGAIRTTGSEIQSLEKRMKQLKDEYANMIRFAQRNRSSYQRMMFVFASEDFNQAYKRLTYLRQYSEHRKQQAALIEATQKDLNLKREQLENQKVEKQTLMASELDQKSALEQDKKAQDKILSTLQQRESQLKKQLAEKQRAKKRIDDAIAAAVRKEIEAAKKRATAAGKKNVTTANVFTLTPEAQKLSAGFANNKGRLPWPVEKGSISERFGEHPHPELKGIIVKNNGIDIRSTPGSIARSIFDGEVTGVINIPGANSAVIVRHGEYLSVYSNLESVLVKKGDKLSTRQAIGKIVTNSDAGAAELHLEIWKGTVKLDPALWLASR